MGKYLHYYGTQAAFETAYNGSDYIEPWVSYTEGVGLNFNMTEEQKIAKYVSMPLTIEALGTGTITFDNHNPYVYGVTQYKKNDGEWTTLTSAQEISVVSGDEVQFKGTVGTSYYSEGSAAIKCTAQYNVKGNLMSLGGGDNFASATTITMNYLYTKFFRNQTNLLSAKNLVMPATTLSTYCYEYMFEGCTNLVYAPQILPSMTLSDHCYYYMFKDCSSLITAPALPATTLVSDCYNCMFINCTSLETAPELPATTLANSCYFKTFYGCTSLNYVKCLDTTLNSDRPSYAYEQWMYNVSSTGTFVKAASAKTIAETQGQPGYVWALNVDFLATWTIENA